MTKFSTIICGHRGGGGDPESVKALTAGADWSRLGRAPDHYDYRDVWANRLPTFTYMLEKGITCFELDLLPSRDGDTIVVHNSVIEGRNVWELSTQELQQAGCSKLDDLLDIMAKFQNRTKKKVTLLLEVKGTFSSELMTDIGQNGISEQSKILINKVTDIITERATKHGWGYDQLPVIGFNHPMLVMAKQKNPDIKIGFSYSRESFDLSEEAMNNISPSKLINRMIDDAKTAGAYAINPDDRFVNRELVDRAHEAGLKVQSWTSYRILPRPKEMMQLGVDTLITDCPLEALTLSASV